MQYLSEFLVMLPLMIICVQVYFFSASRLGKEKQHRCQVLGIIYVAIGAAALVVHKVVYVMAGFVLIMLGLRLIAHGLDRIEKKVFIDRYEEDR